MLGAELKALGIGRTRPLRGGVAFFCTPDLAYKACLWSRLASRIVLILGRVPAASADELYAGAVQIPWEEVLAPGAAFTVRAHGTNAALRNTRFTALKVKDAIADRMRDQGRGRADDRGALRAAIEVRLTGEKAALSFDFSGEALSHRSYILPEEGEQAALACLQSASVLALSGWSELVHKQGSCFIDPVCRTGIMLAEAVGMAADCAPGLMRPRWGFEAWAHYDEEVFDELLEQADDRFAAGLERLGMADASLARHDEKPELKKMRFAGACTLSADVAKARERIRRAGLRQVVRIELADAESIGSIAADVLRAARTAASQGRGDARDGASCLVASVLQPASSAAADSQTQVDESLFVATASASVAAGAANLQCAIAGSARMQERFGCAPVAQGALGSGKIELPYAVFDQAPQGMETLTIVGLTDGIGHAVDVFEANSEQFAARLRKVVKERRKWAAEQGVSCYRVYDADLPDYAVAIDVYTAADARATQYAYVAEYAAPASVDEAKAARRFADVLAIVPAVLGVSARNVFAKTRRREKGGSQYAASAGKSHVATVRENGLLFEVDLGGRLDTGLFLDHRETRALIRGKAENARFLNLFAYTGSATVYAAAGGARSTVTVDLSRTYLDWAQRNMAATGFEGDAHTFEKADVAAWITTARRSGRRFDLIFVDPPTFSNSKQMGKRTWDVQRDHAELLIGVAHLLSEEGLGIFSCNLRSFKPDAEKLAKYGVELTDITAQTIPEDFARNPKIHKCYLFKRVMPPCN